MHATWKAPATTEVEETEETDRMSGMSGAWATFYAAWAHRLHGWLRALGVSDHDRDDLATEVMVVAWRRWSSFDGRHPGPWLYSICYWVARKYRWRKALRLTRERPEPGDQLDDRAGSEVSPERTVRSRKAVQRIELAISALPGRERQAFVLHKLEGHSMAEAARLMGVTDRAVETYCTRARRRLREALEHLLPELDGKD